MNNVFISFSIFLPGNSSRWIVFVFVICLFFFNYLCFVLLQYNSTRRIEKCLFLVAELFLEVEWPLGQHYF